MPDRAAHDAGEPRAWPIPPGSPEARAAIERVRQRLAAEEARVATGLPWTRKRRRSPHICRCGRAIRRRDAALCWSCRQQERRARRGEVPHGTA